MHRDAKRILRVGIIAVFFIFIFVYAFYRSYSLIFGVKIRDVNIENGQTYTESAILIEGRAKNATELRLNGRPISIDQEGKFNETIVLNTGYNTVSIWALDKFGHEDEEHYQLIYEKNEEE